MKDRIIEVRNIYKLNKTEFAKRIGITQPSLTLIEQGKTLPSATTLAAICIEFNIDGTWLLTGKKQPHTYEELTPEEMAIIMSIRALK